MKENSLTTRELWAKLFSSPTVDGFFNESGEFTRLPDFSDYIKSLCKEKGEKPKTVLERGCIESSYGHRLFSGTRNPSRDTIIQFAFGFELNVEETQRLLKVGRAASLHPKVKRDAVIAFCLSKKKTLMETQFILEKEELPSIGGVKYGV